MVSLGYKNQVCIDFSSIVIKETASRYASQQDSINWQVMDVRHMTEFDDNSFEVAIDKGTLDAMIWGSPWDPPPDVRKNTSEYISEVEVLTCIYFPTIADHSIRS